MWQIAYCVKGQYKPLYESGGAAAETPEKVQVRTAIDLVEAHGLRVSPRWDRHRPSGLCRAAHILFARPMGRGEGAARQGTMVVAFATHHNSSPAERRGALSTRTAIHSNAVF